jgi:hypothetical protein
LGKITISRRALGKIAGEAYNVKSGGCLAGAVGEESKFANVPNAKFDFSRQINTIESSVSLKNYKMGPRMSGPGKFQVCKGGETGTWN